MLGIISASFWELKAQLYIFGMHFGDFRGSRGHVRIAMDSGTSPGTTPGSDDEGGGGLKVCPRGYSQQVTDHQMADYRYTCKR